jgi:chemotaxis protein MotA
MTAMLDPWALALVVLGAFGLAFVQYGWGAARRSVVVHNLDASPEAEAAAAERLIHAAAAAISHRGLFAAETLAPRHHFLRASLAELADAQSTISFTAAMARLCDRASEDDRLPVRFWIAIADAAPALGMIGTVAGMIGMAGTMGDGATTGSHLALALTSTLYGLILSACIAAPLAERAQRRAEAGDRWRTRLTDAFVELVARETSPKARLAA